MRDALTAGPQHAATDVATTIVTTEANVARSVGVTSPYSDGVITCVDAIAAASPSAIPPSVMALPCRTTIATTWPSRGAQSNSGRQSPAFAARLHTRRRRRCRRSRAAPPIGRRSRATARSDNPARRDRIGERHVERFHVELGLRAAERSRVEPEATVRPTSDRCWFASSASSGQSRVARSHEESLFSSPRPALRSVDP